MCYLLLYASFGIKTSNDGQDSIFIAEQSAKKQINIGAMLPKELKAICQNSGGSELK